jgi:hopene-associated glycosyltransferase HpnB
LNALVGISLLALVFWLAVLLDRRRAWPAELALPRESGAPILDIPVVALVPARDEAEILPQTLPSLLEQDHRRFHILLIDDNSSDATPETALRLARASGREDRLDLLRAPPTSPGWAGKVHALSTGLSFLESSCEARGEEPPEWILLNDADIRHSKDAVRALLARALSPSDRPYDLVSIMARLHVATFWERLLIPPFVFFFQLLYPFRSVSRLDSRVAAAAGGCVLVRRKTLLDAGGFAALRDAVIDDIALARKVQAAGGRLWLGLDAEVRSLRRYRGLSEIRQMVARTAFVQLRYRWDLLVLVLLGLPVFVGSPPFVTAAALFQATAGEMSISTLAALAFSLAAWALQASLLLPAVRHHRAPSGFVFGLPLAGIIYAFMTAGSAWAYASGRGPRWKGRSQPAGQSSAKGAGEQAH